MRLKCDRGSKTGLMRNGWEQFVVGVMAYAVLSSPLFADVAPPVEIRMIVPTQRAVSGERSEGVFEIEVFSTGIITDIELAGIGWTILTVDKSVAGSVVEPGLFRVRFTAIPQDANERLELTVRWNGRKVTRSYEFGPNAFALRGRDRRTFQLLPPGSTAGQINGGPPAPGGDGDESEPTSTLGCTTLRFTGRIVYTRPMSLDGDGIGVGEQIEGVDGIRVEVMDVDLLSDETIWSGLTNADGFFDSGNFAWDDCDIGCDVGCDDPDLYLRAVSDTDVVQVQSPTMEEEPYAWSTLSSVVNDFTGSAYDFGTLTPEDSADMPVLQIHTGIVRTHRFILTRAGVNTEKVNVLYPDGNNAFYRPATRTIHVSVRHAWRESTHTHEYGHHFLTTESATTTPDYCNDFCDGVEACTSGTDCEDTGHCIWCPETDHDAWNEGWPNWLADVFTRSLPNDYQFSNGMDWTPLSVRPQELLGVCCQDNQDYSDSALDTEGFAGALLRDIEDETQDEHDNDGDGNLDVDGIIDSLCLGVDEIFAVVTLDQPTTPVGFLTSFLARYPEHEAGLWPTAYNVSPLFVVGVGFGADFDPPGVVSVLDSPTHPLGVGGPLPCITVAWEHAPDDVTGACNYSYEWGTDPAGIEPDEIADPVDTSACLLRVTAGFGPGEYYFSVKAQDCSGKWSNQWMPHGPFEITDCNGTGVLDLCDISCSHPGYPGCTLSPSFCSVGGCGLSQDCQPNLTPDECDIVDGTSEDCNETDVPDECEEIFHWAEGGVAWDDSKSWEEDQTPTIGSDVCIDVPGSATALIGHGTFDIGILACEETLDIASSTNPRPDVTLNDPSWVRGDLKLHGNTGTLRVDDRLDIDGRFEWTGSNNSLVTTLTGVGETHVHGGMTFVGIAPLDGHRLILEPGSSSTSTGWFLCPGNSTVEIKQGATLDHQGTGNAFSQCWSSQLINDGTIIRSAATGNSWFDIPLINNGLIHIQSGELTLSRGSTQTGSVVGDASTIFRIMGGGHDFLPSSSIVADKVEFNNHISGSNFIRGTYNVTGSTTKNSGQTLTFTDEANIISYGPTFSILRGTVNFDAIIGGPIHFDGLTVGSSSGGTARFNSGDPVDVDVLAIGPGTLSGPGTITVNTQFTWRQSSTILGPGIIDLNGDTTVGTGGGQKTLLDRTMNNHGYMTMNGGFQMNGTSQFTNHPNATVDMRVDSGGAVIGGGPSIPFINQGTLLKSAGPGNSDITSPVTNTGTVEIQVGKIEFRQPFVQTAGQTILNGGGFHVWWPTPFIPHIVFDGGVLTGSGAFTSNQAAKVKNVGATVKPGLSLGGIEIDGTYNQLAGGTLEIEIGGTSDGEYDTLDMTSTATLAGTLNVTEFGGFEASPGDSFVILTASSVVGEFDTVNIPLGYQVTYHPTNVTLSIPVPGDIDGDGDVDVNDFRIFQLCFTGDGIAPSSSCPADADADFDNNGNVDLDDYALFHAFLTGMQLVK